jgi:hypothetical protein
MTQTLQTTVLGIAVAVAETTLLCSARSVCAMCAWHMIGAVNISLDSSGYKAEHDANP